MFGIVENVQRHDLNAIEEAEGYKRLIDEFSYDQEQVAKFICKSRSHITNSLRLLTLSNYITDLIKINFEKFNKGKILKIKKILINDEPEIIYKDEIMYALGNIIQNAIFHSKSTVTAKIIYIKRKYTRFVF